MTKNNVCGRWPAPPKCHARLHPCFPYPTSQGSYSEPAIAAIEQRRARPLPATIPARCFTRLNPATPMPDAIRALSAPPADLLVC